MPSASAHVQARDEDGNARLSGGDAFAAHLELKETSVPVQVSPRPLPAALLCCAWAAQFCAHPKWAPSAACASRADSARCSAYTCCAPRACPRCSASISRVAAGCARPVRFGLCLTQRPCCRLRTRATACTGAAYSATLAGSYQLHVCTGAPAHWTVLQMHLTGLCWCQRQHSGRAMVAAVAMTRTGQPVRAQALPNLQLCVQVPRSLWATPHAQCVSCLRPCRSGTARTCRQLLGSFVPGAPAPSASSCATSMATGGPASV